VSAKAWPGLFIAPFAFFANLSILYTVIPWTCGHQQRWPLHAVAATTLALAALGMLWGFAAWRRARGAPGADGADAATRVQFLGMVGALMSALFALAIAAQWFAQFVISPCLA
jgi:hypothetical protein